ncbi:hypothetical protein WICPIJ_003822 [Wickerhamomyces pijperi]|uniref:Uncharacterized protein n=1 Tax=Wickerhamomyces pijperi TaxID=599730 RepID=A0A9P8Q6X7_WICPI|nr:hypothetical protein WICPIJ_003822 [Wickerhamomyces pijperi]
MNGMTLEYSWKLVHLKGCSSESLLISVSNSPVDLTKISSELGNTPSLTSICLKYPCTYLANERSPIVPASWFTDEKYSKFSSILFKSDITSSLLINSFNCGKSLNAVTIPPVPAPPLTESDVTKPVFTINVMIKLIKATYRNLLIIKGFPNLAIYNSANFSKSQYISANGSSTWRWRGVRILYLVYLCARM